MATLANESDSSDSSDSSVSSDQENMDSDNPDNIIPVVYIYDESADEEEQRLLNYDRVHPQTPDRVSSSFEGDMSIDGDTSFDEEYADMSSLSSYTVAAISPTQYLKWDPTPDTQYPKPDWITVKELQCRKYGFASSKQIKPNFSSSTFERQAKSSLWMIQRLKKTNTLEEHTGCVNSLDFDTTGRLLCSGSDDRYVCIWDWQSNKLATKINSFHSENIIESLFCNSNCNLVTASRDSTVRLIDIESGETDKLFETSEDCECRLAFTSPESVIVCSTSGGVNMIDLRSKETERLLVARDRRKPDTNVVCGLHTISVHPIDKYKIVVAGSSPFVRVYDLRYLTSEATDNENEPTHYFDCSDNEDNIITSTAYNSTGDKLLINYNDDDLVVCRTDTYETLHRYKGHRNRKTIKGCLWFGDNYVMSGSDDGHIYGWELESEHIVCFLKGDSKIVNTLCLHPDVPVLATSGLDYDVKIWEPNADTWPQTLKGIKQHICRNTMRRKFTHDLRSEHHHAFDDESEADIGEEIT